MINIDSLDITKLTSSKAGCAHTSQITNIHHSFCKAAAGALFLPLLVFLFGLLRGSLVCSLLLLGSADIVLPFLLLHLLLQAQDPHLLAGAAVLRALRAALLQPLAQLLLLRLSLSKSNAEHMHY